jgi:hypothetical protein
MAARTLPENSLFPDILRLEQKVGLCAANNASVKTNFPAFHFRLSPPTFPIFSLKLFYALQ